MAETEGEAKREAAVATIRTVLVVVVVVVLATAVIGGLALRGSLVPAEPPPTAAFSLSASGERITPVHRAGDPIESARSRFGYGSMPTRSTDSHRSHFFVRGFRPGPTGPLNSAADPTWTASEAASLRIAVTSEPVPGPGSIVEVAAVVDGVRVRALNAKVT